MSFVTWKIEREPFSNNAWGSSETLSSYHDVILSVGLGEKKDTFQFKVTNTNDDFTDYFSINDKITFGRALNSTSVAGSDTLMVGVLNKVPVNETYNKNSMVLSGVNFSETTANAIVFIDSYGQTIPNMLTSAVNSVALFNDNFKVTWHSSNPSLKQDGSAFPDVDEKFFYKPLKTIIEKYSTNDGTTDGNYYWYIDKDNKLVWRPRSGSVSYTFNYITDTFKEFKSSKDTNNVKNYVIVKGGQSPKGKGIQLYVPDWTSIAKHGMKYYYMTDLANKAETVVDADKNAYGVDDMSSASYPLTPSWSSSSIANYNDYDIALVVYIRGLCTTYAKAYLDLHKYGKLKIQLGFRAGSKAWGLGDLIQANNLPTIASGKLTTLRISEIQYTTITDTFVLEEDTGTI